MVATEILVVLVIVIGDFLRCTPTFHFFSDAIHLGPNNCPGQTKRPNKRRRAECQSYPSQPPRSFRPNHSVDDRSRASESNHYEIGIKQYLIAIKTTTNLPSMQTRHTPTAPIKISRIAQHSNNRDHYASQHGKRRHQQPQRIVIKIGQERRQKKHRDANNSAGDNKDYPHIVDSFRHSSTSPDFWSSLKYSRISAHACE